MGDVYGTGRTDDGIFAAMAADMDHQEQHRRDAPWTGHPPMSKSHARRVGMMGMSAQCQECGTVCMANHELGAFVGPPDDPWRHFFPWRVAQAQPEPERATETTDDRLPVPTFGSDRKRPAGIPDGVPHRPKPTRELRRLQQQRARAKERGEPITPDMFVSTKAYLRWRKRYGRDGVIVAELPEKPPKAKRPRFTSLRRKAVEPEEPLYVESVPDWEPTEDDVDTELAELEAEAAASLAKLRALNAELDELERADPGITPVGPARLTGHSRERDADLTRPVGLTPV